MNPEEFRQFQSQFEGKEKFGKNVEIRATFMRHATKAEASDVTGESLLSEKGKKEARRWSEELETKTHCIKAYTSPVGRALETANLVLEEQDKKGAEIFKMRRRAELALLPGSESFYKKLVEITKENLPSNYGNLVGDEKQEAFEKAEDVSLDWWLKQGDEKFDDKTTSPKEVAADVAKLVDRYIRMSDRLYSGSSVYLLNVSHKGTLEPFLKEVMLRRVKDEGGEENIVRGFKDIQEIGGGMRPAESWELNVKTDESGNKDVKLSLRNRDYDLDMDRLNELVALSKEKEQKE